MQDLFSVGRQSSDVMFSGDVCTQLMPHSTV